MSRPIQWVPSGANFNERLYKHANGRPVTRPNTQVTALAILEHHFLVATSYDNMLHILTDDLREWANKPGRRSRHRKFWQENPEATLHRYRAPMEFLKPWIGTHYPSLIWVATTWVGAGTKLHLDEGVFETDKVILARLSSDQIVPILDGVAHYPHNPNVGAAGGSRMVYGYWTTP